jgi:tetratricopeptide (TPR) repeat protein
MKNINKFLSTVLGVSLIFSTTGCIDETIPTNTVTENQLSTSAKATESLVWAMPAFANKLNVLNGSAHYDWGYGSIMHIRDVMTTDMTVVSSGYDWYSRWASNEYMGENYVYCQFFWNYFYQYILTTNNIIGAVDEESATDLQLGYLGIGYAYRGFLYLELAQMFEFLENDATSSPNEAGNNILLLTVPIVRETTTDEEARNNPRVPRQEMYEFILSDFNKAEEYIGKAARMEKTLPDLSVLYGLKARLYMWVGDYSNAKTYARKAIDAGNYTPTTKTQWLDTNTGFNDLSTSSWMWGSQMRAEDDVVQTGIVNWTSWMSNEAQFGYANAGPFTMIDARTYSKISNDDFRKLSWVAPEGHPLAGKTPFTDSEIGAGLGEYFSVKFRSGKGDLNDYKVGAASAYPLMRIEEMYLIEAEAAAHSNAAEGKSLLENFMQTYRYASYTCPASDKDGVIDEIFFQKRVEFWGEGITFFDFKRLNKPVLRGYEGTNHSDTRRFNTTTRPAWMNICIVRTEKNNNEALVGFENPDPSNKYTPWTNE